MYWTVYHVAWHHVYTGSAAQMVHHQQHQQQQLEKPSSKVLQRPVFGGSNHGVFTIMYVVLCEKLYE
tara:strand:- start:682 stop:882 length:201 start_codon:yes stop_codon:yes gene_type:complete